MNEEKFVIDTDEKAEWALRKIRDAREEHSRLLALADAERQRIDRQIAQFDAEYERDTAWLNMALEQYFDTVAHKSTKTQEKYQLLSGSLVRKKGGIQYTRDDAAMVKWLEENRHSDFLKTTVKPDWENLKKLTTVQEGFVVLTDTGEIVDGVTAAYAPDEFIVKI